MRYREIVSKKKVGAMFSRIRPKRRWRGWMLAAGALLAVVEGHTHVASEIVGGPRKIAFLKDFRLNGRRGESHCFANLGRA